MCPAAYTAWPPVPSGPQRMPPSCLLPAHTGFAMLTIGKLHTFNVHYQSWDRLYVDTTFLRARIRFLSITYFKCTSYYETLYLTMTQQHKYHSIIILHILQTNTNETRIQLEQIPAPMASEAAMFTCNQEHSPRPGTCCADWAQPWSWTSLSWHSLGGAPACCSVNSSRHTADVDIRTHCGLFLGSHPLTLLVLHTLFCMHN